MANTTSLRLEVVNLVTSDTVNLFNLAMCASARKHFQMEMVPYSDG